MRKLSRWMPKSTKRVIPMGIALPVALVVLLGTLAFSFTAFIVIVGFVLLAVILGISDHLRLRRLAEQRRGENICTFARAFDRRVVDPWVIRAVYEEFYGYYNSTLPIRAVDRIEEELRIDSEDLEDLVRDAALRVGRSMEYEESNPLFGQVRNVGDVVLFLTHQPPDSAA